MTATPSCDNELNGVQILLESFATECEAIAIEQSPDHIDDIQTASGVRASHRWPDLTRLD
jgi:hypothetical protein